MLPHFIEELLAAWTYLLSKEKQGEEEDIDEEEDGRKRVKDRSDHKGI